MDTQNSANIILAATPIGNISDTSQRFMQTLATADIIAAEDTRKIRHLATKLDIKISGKIISYYEHNETIRNPQLIDYALLGKTVLVVSDAGMPTISDPGYSLVQAAYQKNLTVTAIPGPSAILTALALSGLSTSRFCFEGFMARKSAQRQKHFKELLNETRTIIFFETPHRIMESLADAATILGKNRHAAVCRELTKTYEQICRGTLEDLQKIGTETPFRGEIVFLIAGAPQAAALSIEQCAMKVSEMQQDGTRLKEAVRQVANKFNVSSRELYDYIVKQKKSSNKDLL